LKTRAKAIEPTPDADRQEEFFLDLAGGAGDDVSL
jgi:hypothetical protein